MTQKCFIIVTRQRSTLKICLVEQNNIAKKNSQMLEKHFIIITDKSLEI